MGPDLVLLDINLPKKNGHEVLASIRKMGRLADTCVVMCSGSSLDFDYAQARSNHANAYILKPMDLREMDVTVKGLREILTSLSQGTNHILSF
jgi:DNA-binding response OmpR family regulator